MLINVRIDGVSPLLQHRFPEPEEGTPPAPPGKKDQTRMKDNVKGYLYKNEEGIYQPSIHIIRSMMKAGARFQIPGRGKLTYKNIIGSGVIIVIPDAIPHIYQEWVIDRRSVIVNRARIIRSRPCFNKWALKFQLDIDADEVPPPVAKEILEYAGKRVGLGDFRPEKGGAFGRFQVTEWKLA